MTDDEDSDFDETDDPDAEDRNDEPAEVVCPYCKRAMPEEALQCPHCGSYLSLEDAPRSYSWWWLLVVALLVAVIILFWTRG
jgi:uncharacterized paraquat-inducible protein A